MRRTHRIKRGEYVTEDGRFGIRRDDANRQWFVTGKDAAAENALRATAHLRGYGRLRDAESWIFGTVYPHIGERTRR
jgi:hypothetical protein